MKWTIPALAVAGIGALAYWFIRPAGLRLIESGRQYTVRNPPSNPVPFDQAAVGITTNACPGYTPSENDPCPSRSEKRAFIQGTRCAGWVCMPWVPPRQQATTRA